MLLTDAHYKNKILKKNQAQVVVRNIILPIIPCIILRVSSNMSICISRGVAFQYSVRQADKPVNNATDHKISVGGGKQWLNPIISLLDGFELLKYTRSAT